MRVVMLSHATTDGVRQARFGGASDPALPTGPAGLATAARLTPAALGAARARQVLHAADPACESTAHHLGLPLVVEAALAGCEYGRWSGLGVSEVHASDPEGLAVWLADVDSAPHGGESLAALRTRVGRWLDGLAAGPDPVLAVTDAAVLRAAVAHAVDAGPGWPRRFEVAPLYRAVLTGKPGAWSLRELGPAPTAITEDRRCDD